jgi:hypothetical protein
MVRQYHGGRAYRRTDTMAQALLPEHFWSLIAAHPGSMDPAPPAQHPCIALERLMLRYVQVPAEQIDGLVRHLASVVHSAAYAADRAPGAPGS